MLPHRTTPNEHFFVRKHVTLCNATRVDTDFIFTAGYSKLLGAKTTILVTFDHACGY